MIKVKCVWNVSKINMKWLNDMLNIFKYVYNLINMIIWLSFIEFTTVGMLVLVKLIWLKLICFSMLVKLYEMINRTNMTWLTMFKHVHNFINVVIWHNTLNL